MKKFLKLSFCVLMLTVLTIFTGCPDEDGGGGGSGGGGGEQSGGGGGGIFPGAIELTADTWSAEGSLPASGEQYFKFTANASTQYILANFGDVYVTYGISVQLYDNNGATKGSATTITSSYATQSSFTSGQVYYIKAKSLNTSSAITLRIAFSAFPRLPGTVITPLTEDQWADGKISSTIGGDWYKFTATDAAQYIYVNFNMLKNGLYVQLYDMAGAKILTNSQLLTPSSNKATISNLTAGQEYYINVTQYYSNTGMYQITFNKTGTAPATKLPSNADGATQLTIDKWIDSDLTTSVEQWYKFTATANTSYSIHIGFGSLFNVSIQFFDSNGSTVGDSSSISSLTGNQYTPLQQLTAAGDYYIMVSASGNGSYRIAYSTSTSLPPVELPSTGITQLTADSYTDAEMQIQGTMSDIEQWYKFTATAASHYIHVSFGTFGELTGLYFQIYDNSGNTVFGSKSFTMRDRHYEITTLTPGTTYYIKLWPYNYSNTGTYKIAYNTTILPPDSKTLTVDVLADGNILTPNDEQWFKFTATAAAFQDIYVEFGTLNNLSIQVYDSSGNTVGSSFYLSTNSGTYKNIDVTNGSVYFIRVKSNASSLSGTYKIAFGTAPW